MLIDIAEAHDKYGRIKSRAKQRKIDFDLSFEDWMKVWLDSGHWTQRGKGIGKYNMSRYNDVGPYSIDNVFIQPHSGNASDAHKGKPKSAESKLKNKLSNLMIDHSNDWRLRQDRQPL